MLTALSIDQIVQILVTLTHDLEAAKDVLTDLDSAIGDGDLGITFSRGAVGIRDALQDYPQDIGRLLLNVGFAFSDSAGSTMGALLGTAFMQAGKEVKGQTEVRLPELARMIRAAASGIHQRGKANPGDKTMLDALVPAAQALEKAIEEDASLVEGLHRAQVAAEQGAQSTTGMKAAFGRARWLGERTIGNQDPGAAAVAIMFQSVLRSVSLLVAPGN